MKSSKFSYVYQSVGCPLHVKCLFKSFVHFLILGFLIFSILINRNFKKIHSLHEYFVRCRYYKYLSHSGLPFYSLNCKFWWAEHLNFNIVQFVILKMVNAFLSSYKISVYLRVIKIFSYIFFQYLYYFTSDLQSVRILFLCMVRGMN